MQKIINEKWVTVFWLVIIISGFIFLPSQIINAQDNSTTTATSTALVPIEEFTAFDTPNDAGGSVSLTWKVSLSDQKGTEYIIWSSYVQEGPWKEVSRLDSTRGLKSDAPEYFGLSKSNKQYHFFEVRCIPEIAEECITGTAYFKMEMVAGNEKLAETGIVSAIPNGNWFDKSKINILVCVIIFSGLIIYFIGLARKNKNLFIRHIPGLDAIEEAIGRATEMGKSVLYLNGLTDMSSLSTIASTSILAKVARKVANYDSQLKVPCYDPIVMSICHEVVKEAYIEAGRPDAFKEDNIFYVSNDQFAYAAAVDGLIIRERPAANLFMGYYYAEALLLAEAGAATGAIQIAGTDSITQLPFFITTCDYTLMGEELYAASAYLSREPLQLGSLKGQDVTKALIILFVLIGVIFSTFGSSLLVDLFRTF